MTDPEIQLSELKHQRRRRRGRRPDRNRHYAVVSCQAPAHDDLAVFIELDAMRDIEAHARSNPRVELGGVLLGSQYEDEDGQPFVVVYDSLRAEHYHATKGSFTFTHDTWSEITRQRDGFPDDMEMVGWYHTHPGWGVFLSGQDLFICEHFFNGPLDVALVVDPSNGQRGWFQWHGGSSRRMRPIGGFHVIASRHRRAELELAVAQWEGKLAMANEPPGGSYPGPGGLYPVPVAASSDGHAGWQAVAVIGMLAVQFVFLALIAWKLLFPPPAGTAGPAAPAAALAAGSDQPAGRQRDPRALDAKLEVLDRVVSQLADGSADGVVRMLEEARRENQKLKDDARVYRALEARVAEENKTLAQRLAHERQAAEELRRQVAELRQTITEHEQQEQAYQRQIAALEEKLASRAPRAAAAELDTTPQRPRLWLWAAAALAAVAIVALGLIIAVSKRPGEEDRAVMEPGDRRSRPGDEPANHEPSDRDVERHEE